MERVGFVGTGIMGAPMARNAMKAGFSVTVTNRTSSRAAPLAKDGATVVKTPREVAERSEIVVTMVPNTPDNLIKWLQNPQAVDPQNAMPNLGLTSDQSNDIAAFLSTLK